MDGKKHPILLSWALGKVPFPGAEKTAALLGGEAPPRARPGWGHLSEASGGVLTLVPDGHGPPSHPSILKAHFGSKLSVPPTRFPLPPAL